MKKEDKEPFDENGEPHGYWEIYHDDGKLWYKGNYIHGLPHGLWEEYSYYHGNLLFKTYYINGERSGSWEWYDHDGYLECKTYYIK